MMHSGAHRKSRPTLQFEIFAVMLLGTVIANAPQAKSQDNVTHIDNENGSTFMEEVPSNRPDAQGSPSAPRVQMKRPANLQELGIPLNSNGHIVPLIERDGDPIMPLGTSGSVTTEALPYSNYGPYVMGRAGLTNYPYSGYGPYATPYYRGYPAPYWNPNGYGYGTGAGVNLRLGKVRLNIGTTPYGYGNGYGYRNGIGPGTPFSAGYGAPSLFNPYGASSAAAPFTGSAPGGGELKLSPGKYTLVGPRTGIRTGPYFGAGYYTPGALGYIPTMYSSTGMGGYTYSSNASGTGFPFGFNSSTQSSGGLLAPLLH